MKDIPVIVISDDDSDAPITNKRRRLVKNGAIQKNKFDQVQKKHNHTKETRNQRMKKLPLIVISDDDTDEQDETKAKLQKTLLKNETITKNNVDDKSLLDNKKETKDGIPIGFNTHQNKELKLIDEPTDDEFNEYENSNDEELLSFFGNEAYDDDGDLYGYANFNEEIFNFYEEQENGDVGEELYHSDMYSVISVSDGDDSTDSFINDGSLDYHDTDENTDDDI